MSNKLPGKKIQGGVGGKPTKQPTKIQLPPPPPPKKKG
jgi:hypothetical protein